MKRRKKCKDGYRRKKDKCVKRDDYDDDDDSSTGFMTTMLAVGVADGIGTGLPP